MNYFENASDINSLRSEYKRLSKELHPDVGGCEEKFKEMQAQYLKMLKNFQKPDTPDLQIIKEYIIKGIDHPLFDDIILPYILKGKEKASTILSNHKNLINFFVKDEVEREFWYEFIKENIENLDVKQLLRKILS